MRDSRRISMNTNTAVRMMEQTGADGVMIARYGLEDPLIFAKLTGTELITIGDDTTESDLQKFYLPKF